MDRAIIAVLAVALAYFIVDKLLISKHLSTPLPAASSVAGSAAHLTESSAPPAAPAFNPPPHSIAVLPFVNMSGDKEQDYFSDGLTEELLNSLARINELQVVAFDWYLRASKAYSTAHNAADLLSAVAAYNEAVRQDPQFALAFAGRSQAFKRHAGEWATGPAAREEYEKALADARQAIALAPQLAEAHLALGDTFEWGFLDFGRAAVEYAQAVDLAHGNARVLESYGTFMVLTKGNTDGGLTAIRQAIVLDPLNTEVLSRLGEAQWAVRQYEQALATFNAVIALDPAWARPRGWRGFAYYGLGGHAREAASRARRPLGLSIRRDLRAVGECRQIARVAGDGGAPA